MNLFKRFFARDNTGEINEIKKLFENKDFDSVIQRATRVLSDLNSEDRAVIIKLLALSYFSKKENGFALPYFEEIALNSTNSDDWFNVTTTAILARQVDKGMNAFSNAIKVYQKHGTRQNMPIGQMSYYVMQAFRDTEEYDLAFVQLMKLKDVYCQLKTTDSTFLHLRGLPFLGHVLEASKSIIKNQNIENSQKWLKEFASELDNEGKVMVEKVAIELKK